jgi:hypothetical protein
LSPNTAENNRTPESGSTQNIVGDVGVVETVRKGVLTGYNSTTVGKAFEGTFQNPKWTSFKTPKGATVVEFNGTFVPRPSSTWKAVEHSINGFADILMDESLPVPSAIVHPVTEACIGKLNLTQEVHDAHWKEDWYWMFNPEHARDEVSAKIKSCVNESLNAPVSFQFTVLANSGEKESSAPSPSSGSGFKLSYIDNKLFGGHEEEALAFIYR